MEPLNGVDVRNVFDQLHAVPVDVVQAADEGRQIGSACFGRQNGLTGREYQGAIGANARFGEVGDGLNAFFDHGNFYHDVFVQGGQFFTFGHHAGKVGADDFSAHIAINHFANGFVVLQHSRVAYDAFFGHQARVGGDTVQNAQIVGFLNLGQIGRIDEKFHDTKVG